MANGWARFVLLCEIVRPPDGPHNRRAMGEKSKPMTIFSVFFFTFFIFFSFCHTSTLPFSLSFLVFSLFLSLFHSITCPPLVLAV